MGIFRTALVFAAALALFVTAVADPAGEQEGAHNPAMDQDLWSLGDEHGCLADIAGPDPSVLGPDGVVNIHGEPAQPRPCRPPSPCTAAP